MDVPAILVKDFSFSFDTKNILSELSLQINPGERWAIIGRNGAGKSTLIRCLAGLEKVPRSLLFVNGTDLRSYEPRELAKIVAYVPQIRNTDIPFTVYDYVMMGRFPYQGFMAFPSTEDHRLVRDALDLTDCRELSDRRMMTLSGGEAQRVSIASAVAQRTSIMLLDEPTTFLDPAHQEMVFRCLDRVHAELKTTMLMVTHDINAAVIRNDHVLALCNGRALFQGTIADFAGNELGWLKEVFGIGFEWCRSESGVKMVVPR